MPYKSLQSAQSTGTRAESLQVLAERLAVAVDTCTDDKLLPQLARQYRETVRELDEIAPQDKDGDIDDILAGVDRTR